MAMNLDKVVDEDVAVEFGCPQHGVLPKMSVSHPPVRTHGAASSVQGIRELDEFRTPAVRDLHHPVIEANGRKRPVIHDHYELKVVYLKPKATRLVLVGNR